MKAIVIENYGGAEELIEKDVPKPVIQDNQVLVELHATSVNPVDWKTREGYLKDYVPLDFPVILGWDAAGVVREVGANVRNFQVGDEVFARPATKNGTYAEYVAVDENLLALKPSRADFQMAASVPLAGLTAWQCLIDFASIQSGDKVLIQGGSGGIGSFAIQIAKHFDAHVMATASGKNEALLEELGVDEFINYETTDFPEVVQGADLVVDTIGGEVLKKSHDVLKPGGKLVSVAGEPDKERAKAHQIKAESLLLRPNGKQLAELGELINAGRVKPYIGHTFPLTENGLREAHKLSATGHAKGKIAIAIKA